MRRPTRFAGLLSLSLVSLAFLAFLVHGSMLPAPSSGTWAPTPGVLAEARSGAAAAMLPDGRVLVTGGDGAAGTSLASAEVFSLDGSFTPVAPMTVARSKHVAVALKDGRVLVAGGLGIDGKALSSAEIYDPSSNVWQAALAMVEARSGSTATLLADGKVLVAGGANDSAASATLEVFDPVSDGFVPGGMMTTPRQEHAAALLASGQVLIAGGSDGTNPLASSELWDSASGMVSPGPALSVAREGLSATTLIDGAVLLAGGNDGTNDLAVTEVFDPAAGTVVAGASLLSSARRDHLAVLLPHNASVLIVGGTAAGVPVAGAELYVPWSGGSNPTGSPATARALAVASPTGTDGLLLLAGGKDASGALLNSGEAYGFATLKTDKDDYAPAEQVLMSGSGWEPGDTVNLTLHETGIPTPDPDIILTVTADAAGNIVENTFYTDLHDLGVRFYLTAVGTRSQAQATFTDANRALNINTFSITSPAGAIDRTMNVSQPFTVELKYTGTGSGNWTNVTAMLSAPSGWTKSADPASSTVTAGVQQTVDWTVTPNATTLASGPVSVSLTGTPPAGDSCNSCPFSSSFNVTSVNPALLSITSMGAAKTVGGGTLVKSGDSITVTMTVANDTAPRAAANSVAASALTVNTTESAAGSCLASGTAAANIAAGGNRTYTYTCTAGTGNGTLTFTGSANGTDENSLAAVGTGNSTTNSITVDNAGPTTASVIVPASGSLFRSATVPASFSGTAADATGSSGLNANSTTFTLQRSSDSKYWTGGTWQNAVTNLPTTHAATASDAVAAWTNSGSLPNWAAESDGTYSVQATATDKAGNSFTGAASSFTLDNTAPPTASVIAPANGSSYRTATVPAAFTGSAADNTNGSGLNANSTTFILQRGSDSNYWNGAAWQVAVANLATTHIATTGNTAAAWTSSPALPAWASESDGTFTMQAKATDKAGNTSTGPASTFTLDNSPPAKPVVSELAPGNDTGSSTHDGVTSETTNLNFNGTAEKNSTVNLFVDGSGSSAGSGTTNNSGAWNNIPVSGSLAEGNHSIKATATDAAGNISPLSDALSVLIDLTLPTATIAGHPNDPTNSTSANFTFSGTDPLGSGSAPASGVDHFLCQLDGGGFSTCTSPKNYPGPLSAGSHTFQVEAVDVAGNTSSPASFTWTIDLTPPSVTINQDPLQADPTTSSPVNFKVVFSESVSDFATGDVTLGGTAGATTQLVTGGGTTYNVAVSGMTTSGTVIATIGAGVAHDAANNPNTASTSGDNTVTFNADSIPPTTSINLSGTLGDNSWYTSDVHVTVSATDNPGGTGVAETRCVLDPLVPPASFDAMLASCAYSGGADVTTNGQHTVYAASKDNNDNKETPVVTKSFRIDQVKPTTTATPNPAANANGWNNGNVTVNLNATDNPGGSGVKEITYSASGAQIIPATTEAGSSAAPVISSEGQTTVTFHAKDDAGNVESDQTQTLKLDLTKPTASIDSKPDNPTKNADAEFGFSGTDPLGGGVASGVESFECKLDGGVFAACTSPASYPGLSEGSHTFHVRAVDKAGNTGNEANFTWSIDLTPPATTATLSPAANANGWNNGDTTVNLNAVDYPDPGGSGVKEITYSASGAQTIASTTVAGASAAPVITAEGETTVSFYATDNAGNVEATKTKLVKIDRTKPTATIVDKPDNPTQSTSAHFTFTSNDPMSGGVASGVDYLECKLDGGSFAVCTSPQDFSSLDEGSHTFSVRAVDKAGNVGDAASHTWLVDHTPPTTSIGLILATPDGNNGWYKSNVHVTVSAVDNPGGSGVAETRCVLDGLAPASFDAMSPGCPYLSGGADVTTDGMHVVYAASKDNAANKEAVKSVSFKIDKTLPTVVLTTPPDNAVYLLSQVVAADYSCNDATSGIDTCTGTVANGANIDTATVGTKTFSVTGTDKAGNSKTVTHTYKVQYNFIGFLPPIDNLPIVNSSKAGQTIPVKWQLKDANGNLIGDLSSLAPSGLQSGQIVCSTGDPIDSIEELASPGSTVFRFDGMQFIFNWQTSKPWAGTCRLMQVTLKDGTVHYAKFTFK